MDGQTAQGDSHYEFDAPSHVVDFEAPDFDERDDDWFENQGDALATPARNVIPAETESAISHTELAEEPKSDAQVAPNIVTSWGNSGPAKMAVQAKKKALPAQPLRVPKRKESADNVGAATAPAPKKRRSSILRQQPNRSRRSSAVRRSGAVRRSVRLDPRAAAKARTASSSSVTASSRSATASSSAATSSQPKSSEEVEMERIRVLQKEVADHRKQNEASYKAALAGTQPPRKEPLSTTVPKEFTFSTDGRAKASTAPADASYKETDFVGQLRNHPTQSKGSRGATVPKPFNLSTGSRRKGEEPAPYVSTAQQIEDFQKRTPDRYHLRSRQSQERGPSPGRSQQLRVTEPHTPLLMTRQRSRPALAKSTAELEAEELTKIQQFRFKPVELNRKMLEAAVNPRKPAAKEPTRPEGFQMHMERRLQERQANRKPEEPEETPCFHAAPLPSRILEEVVGVPEKKVQCPTVPESPAFALKNRVRVERKVEEVKPAAPVKALAVPHFALPFQPKLPEKSGAESCPFSFDERERERRARTEKRLEELRNEEKPKFKAQLLPDFHEVVLPEKKVAEPTKPAPFKLLIDERGAVKSDRWEHKMKEEEKRQAEAASFKARPNLVTHKEPFVPKKENRSVLEHNSSVVPEGFQLSTERRAKERQDFDRFLCDEATKRAHAEEQRRGQEEQREKENIARLRQEQVHKAQPVRHYKPVEVKRSEVTLTVPQSPNFSDRFHL